MNKIPVLTLVSGVIGAIISNRITYKKQIKKQTDLENLSDKHKALFLMMNQWVKVKQEGKSLSEYFVKNGYKRIAVYGMSFAGETLLNELKETEVRVLYGIDKNAEGIYLDLNVFTLEDSLDEADAIVVTAVFYFDDIKNTLSKKFNCPIISLEDILYEM